MQYAQQCFCSVLLTQAETYVGRRAMRFLPELVYCEETLDLSQDGLERPEGGYEPASLASRSVCLRLAGAPHVILAVKNLTGPVLGLQRKPSYWDLPVELQSLLLERQLAVSNEVLGLRVKFTSETGSREGTSMLTSCCPFCPTMSCVNKSQGGQPASGLRKTQSGARSMPQRFTATTHARYRELDRPATLQAATPPGILSARPTSPPSKRSCSTPCRH